jgi:hypothetical protein
MFTPTITENNSGGNVRAFRERECYSLTCAHCRREIEIAVTGPHSFPLCKEVLVIEWRPQ